MDRTPDLGRATTDTPPSVLRRIGVTGNDRPTHRRRFSRPTAGDREAAILATARRLLDDKGWADVSVDDLAKGAGLSRPGFYFYFPHRDAVLLALLHRVVHEVDTTMATIITHQPSDPTTLWRRGISVFVRTFRTHRAVALAADERAHANDDINALWATFRHKWIAHSARVIETERARGAAPGTLPAGDLATALYQLNENAILTSPMPDGQLLDALVHIWTASIYSQSATGCE